MAEISSRPKRNIDEQGRKQTKGEKSRSLKEKREKYFQSDLLQYYRECHSKISVSPLILVNDVPLEDFYVQPAMEAIELQGRYGNPRKTPVTSYKQLLFKDEDKISTSLLMQA